MVETESEKLISKLEESLNRSKPIATEEISLIDKFIMMHSSVYQLPGQMYETLLLKILDNRINNAAWQYETASKEHLLRVLQSLRILSRQEELAQIFLEQNGIQYLCQKLHELTNQPSMNKRASEDNSSKTQADIYAETFNDQTCELLTEILSILYKTVNRMGEGPNTSLIRQVVLNDEVLTDLQLLLGVRHNVLLRCVFESILTIFEWVARHNSVDVNLAGFFSNSFTVDMLLQIIEGFSDDFRKLAAETLTYMLRTESQALTQDILRLFKELGGSEKLIGLMTTTVSETVRARLLVCFQTLTSGENQDILAELRDLQFVPILLKMLVSKESSNPATLGSILTILTNLSLNDANNVKIRLHGAHLIGGILMDNCPALNQNLVYSKDPSENVKIQHELQLHCLRCLRFLYSVEKNRKAFKVIFPPNIFGSFIDVGNYNKEFQAYIPLLKRLNKKLPVENLEVIKKNFEQMGNFQKLAGDVGEKFIGGYKVVDLIGKGAYGSVYLVQRGENVYAMKEIPLSHFDVTPDKFEEYLATQNKEGGSNKKSVDDAIVEEICKEVSILKDLNHPNIIKYYTSFADRINVYIVMELLDGYSLADYILSQSEKKHRVKESVIWSIFVQLCASLRYLHVEKRIVHRDLAPGNVLIDGELNLKLADFGLAKRWGTGTQSQASVMKSFVGTILYSCPEIVQSQPYTEKADIWSLGCIMYELMTFNQPFSAGNPLTVAKKIVEGEYDQVDEKHYSPMLINTVKACMTADPKVRPSVLELCQLMIPIVMEQLDSLRKNNQQNSVEIKQLKDKLKVFEGSMTTKLGFGAAAFKNTMTTAAHQTQSNMGEMTDLKMVQVNQDKLKRLNNDPVANFLDMINKVAFVASLPSSLNKDIRQIQVENFYRALFGRQQNGSNIKNEILKLQNGSRELLTVSGFNSSLKQVTYEHLLHTVEDLLRENKFYNEKGS